MAKTLSRFYLLKKDENKDKATLFVRVQDPIRKIDVQFTTRLRVSVPEWKVAVSSEDALARHRKEYPKLHDKLGRIEVMLKREMEAPEFDREKVKHEIMAIADPEKSEIVRRQQELKLLQGNERNSSNGKKRKRLVLPLKQNARISGIFLTVLLRR